MLKHGWTAEKMRSVILAEMSVELDRIRAEHDLLFESVYGIKKPNEPTTKINLPGGIEELRELAARYNGIVDMMDKVRVIGL